MLTPQKLGKNVRMSFSRVGEAIEMPNLLEVQKKSFEWFLRDGLREVLDDVSPIVDYSGNLIIEFVDYSIDPKTQYPVEECKERDVNYAAPLKVRVRLTNKETGEVKESEIYMGDFPMMTDNGTFVINGAERVIVSQIVRSPGIYYGDAIDKTGKHMHTATVIPYRGAWLEYETDASDAFFVKIDKTRKIPITVLVRALGVESDADILAMFGDETLIKATFEKDECATLAAENNTTLGEEALKEIYKKLRPGEPPLVESAQILINNLFFDPKRYDLAPVGRYKYDKKLDVAGRIVGHKLAEPAVNPFTGELVCEAGVTLTREMAREIEKNCVNEVLLALDDGTTLKVFSNNTTEPENLLGFDLRDCGINEKVRTVVLREILEQCGGDVDAVKAEAKKRIHELCPKHITKDDIFASINYLIGLSHGVGSFEWSPLWVMEA